MFSADFPFLASFTQVITIDFQAVLCTFATQQSVLMTAFTPSYLGFGGFQNHSVMELEQGFRIQFQLMLRLAVLELLGS